METTVVWNPEFKLDIGVIRATSANEALEKARNRYDLLAGPLTVCALRDLPKSQLVDALRYAVRNVKGYIPTVDLMELKRTYTAEQAYEALESLASWVVDCDQPHPWLRARTEYDDRADQEVDQWLKEIQLDESDLDSERLEVWRAVRKEVTDRYEAARVAGLPVPDEYIMPPSLVAYRAQNRPLFQRLRERKENGHELVMTREVLETLLDKDGRTLFEVAQLFGTSIRQVCEMVPQEKRGRRRDPVQTVPREVTDRFEQLVYEVNFAQAEEEFHDMDTEAVYVIPVTKRTSTFFSIYRNNYGLDVGRTFERLIEEISQLHFMVLHQLGPKSSWKPKEAVMMELMRWGGPADQDLERVQLHRILGEIEAATVLLQNRPMGDGADSSSHHRLLKALSEAAVSLKEWTRRD